MRHSKKHAIPVSARFTPPRPPGLRRQVEATNAALPVAVATTSRSSLTLMPLIFGIAIGLALLGVAVALMPVWAVPRPILNVVAEHREDIIIGGLGAALCIGASLAIALVGP